MSKKLHGQKRLKIDGTESSVHSQRRQRRQCARVDGRREVAVLDRERREPRLRAAHGRRVVVPQVETGEREVGHVRPRERERDLDVDVHTWGQGTRGCATDNGPARKQTGVVRIVAVPWRVLGSLIAHTYLIRSGMAMAPIDVTYCWFCHSTLDAQSLALAGASDCGTT
jgi:hypothetical protein